MTSFRNKLDQMFFFVYLDYVLAKLNNNKKKQSCMKSGPNDTKGANIFPTVRLHFITNFDFKIDIK